MAGGISPNRVITITLDDYNADHYLTLLYQAMLNMGWHIGYFDHDGIIAYTDISWESYSEEVSARVKGNFVIIKSECVGYQGLFTDYGKNRKNLDRLFNEIPYTEFHLQEKLEETTQDLMNGVPEKQFLSLEDPPMAGKEQLRGFFSPVIPREKYFITPLLVILNTLIFITTSLAFHFLPRILTARQFELRSGDTVDEKLYLLLGFNNRSHVLNGEVWRLLTSVFLHFSIIHWFFNMVVLVYVGSLIESKLGKWSYLLMFLCTGIISSMVSVMWNLDKISAGASGAIFGLFGILLALLSTDFYERSARKALLISTAIFVAYNIIPVGEGTDHAAHFGGIISGYAFGWLAYGGLNHKNSFIKKWGIAIAGSAAVILFVSCGVLFTPHYQVREFARLIQKIDVISNEMNGFYYGHRDDYSRQQKLDTIEQRALPEAKALRKVGDDFNKLKLPSKQKKEAKTISILVNLQCQYYQLLYLEFKEQNTRKYRPQINSITERINDVRAEWHKYGD